jgi:glycosyltransferase involved in cell wall biosynthesis
VPDLSGQYIPDADVVVATAWYTAERVTEYPASKGVPFYLIQSWETWNGPEERVRATWKAPLNKVVIARWLQEKAGSLGVECSCIPNGLDFDRFGLDVAIEERDPNQVMMLYHPHPVKGTLDGIKALSIAKREVPELRAVLFGTPPAKIDVPGWVEYRRLPKQEELRACYNRSSIFLSPSCLEGWPLPPAEAMLCGAALVATDIDGHREYAVHDRTALLSPVKSPGELASNILWLIRNPQFRVTLAKRGNEYIQKFRWASSVDLLEAELVKKITQNRRAMHV